MRIEIRMFMKFKQYLPASSSDGKAMVSLKDGGTLGDLLDTLGIPPDVPKLVIINGISRGVSNTVNAETLTDGDVVAIFPPSGGG
ncbi:MAG: MoaD/ThiS family protein [Thermodesulfobacteriota bacterium]|jgi:molybdopterin converting factor small subunit|nr:MAG: MoaD/ThiS family protein [Thermodesulfobacteriota bacterium]